MKRYSATYYPFPLQFKKPAGTSRGILTTKPGWILQIKDHETNSTGLGECSIIPGLSIDPENEIESKLIQLTNLINFSDRIEIPEDLFYGYPALKFAFEMALLDLANGGIKILFDNTFSRSEVGIPINGLVWMADTENMYYQAMEKIRSGFRCLKFKIGALDFSSELELLARVREKASADIEIRLDANGAFSKDDALSKISDLAAFKIHSIEQPIKPGQIAAMKEICKCSPVPIALDEELIGCFGYTNKKRLLQAINPQFIILKPSLLGGLYEADKWIELADNQQIGWWATSALESNLGLNAIAQWVAQKNTHLPQGLGTGGLYTSNFPVDLTINNGELWFNYNKG